MIEYVSLKEKEYIFTSNQNIKLFNSNPHLIVEENSIINILVDNVEALDSTIDVKGNAIVNIFLYISTNTKFSSKLNVNLLEDGATCNAVSVQLAYKLGNIDSYVMINHLNKATISNLQVYAVGNDEGIIKLDNNAHIIKGASKSSARQSAKGLTLTDNTTIVGQPNLYIDEYDVMASHGVAMGSLNKEDMFYLMSRGLDKKEASKLMTMGFIEPFLSKIDNETINEELRKDFYSKIN